jgi:hypothetical protein
MKRKAAGAYGLSARRYKRERRLLLMTRHLACELGLDDIEARGRAALSTVSLRRPSKTDESAPLAVEAVVVYQSLGPRVV